MSNLQQQPTFLYSLVSPGQQKNFECYMNKYYKWICQHEELVISHESLIDNPNINTPEWEYLFGEFEPTAAEIILDSLAELYYQVGSIEELAPHLFCELDELYCERLNGWEPAFIEDALVYFELHSMFFFMENPKGGRDCLRFFPPIKGVW